MAKKLAKLTGSGWTDYVGPRVRSERAVVRGMKSDAAQFGIRSPGKSVKSSHKSSKRTNRGNVGSFGTTKVSRRGSVINPSGAGY